MVKFNNNVGVFVAILHDIFNMSNIGIKGIIIDIATSASLPSEIVAKVRPVRRDLVDKGTTELKSYTALGLHVISESP